MDSDTKDVPCSFLRLPSELIFTINFPSTSHKVNSAEQLFPLSSMTITSRIEEDTHLPVKSDPKISLDDESFGVIVNKESIS